jgi:hypothetical protein
MRSRASPGDAASKNTPRLEDERKFLTADDADERGFKTESFSTSDECFKPLSLELRNYSWKKIEFLFPDYFSQTIQF